MLTGVISVFIFLLYCYRTIEEKEYIFKKKKILKFFTEYSSKYILLYFNTLHLHFSLLHFGFFYIL